MMSSDISLLGAMPPRPMLRDSTSAPISNGMISSRRHASRSKRSSRRPYHLDSFAISRLPARSAQASVRLGEEFLQFGTVLRTLAEDPGPAGFVGFVVVGLADGAVELDRLNAGVGLTFGVLGVLLGKNPRCLRFRLLARLAQQIALGICELVSYGFVHQHRDLGGIEA